MAFPVSCALLFCMKRRRSVVADGDEQQSREQPVRLHRVSVLSGVKHEGKWEAKGSEWHAPGHRVAPARFAGAVR